MTPEMTSKLNRIKNYSTRYELVATHKDGRKVLVGYSRKGRNGLFSMVAKNGQAWANFAGSDSIHFGKRVTDGATSGDWTVNFSGRTQREAILSGELTFFSRVETFRYIVKCDDCKVEIGKTNSLQESAEGGCCSGCQADRAKFLADLKSRS